MGLSLKIGRYRISAGNKDAAALGHDDMAHYNARMSAAFAIAAVGADIAAPTLLPAAIGMAGGTALIAGVRFFQARAEASP